MIVLLILLVCLVLIIAVIAYLKELFREYHLSEPIGSCHLVGQLKHGISSAQLPNPLGRHIYSITTNGGTLRLNHHALNPDGFAWSLPPDHNEQQHFNITGKFPNAFSITIGESFRHADKVEVVNPDLLKDVEFFYRID